MKKDKSYYSNFDWLRLAFAIQVVAIHSGGFDSVLFNPVPAFIAVSGFVVLGSMERRPVRSFFFSRALRVMPLLILSFAVVGVLFGAAEMWKTVLFWIWPLGSNPVPINAVVWTLIFEEVFYICMAFLFAMKFYKNSYVVLSAFAVSLWAAANPPGFLPSSAYVLFSAFLLGSVVYKFRSVLERVPKWAACAAFAIAMVVSVSLPYGDTAWVRYAVIHSIVIFTALVFAISGPQLPKLPLDISYSLYLFHCIARFYLMRYIPLGVPLFFSMLAVTLPVCLLAWYCVERPALRLRDRVLPLRPTATPASLPGVL